MEEILNIQNLSKHFEGIKAADNINLSLQPYTITGIYGDNGAGKTTLFNLISGFEKPDSGLIMLNGIDITEKSVLLRAQMGMGRLFQNPRIFSEVTVFENLLAASKHSTGHHLFNYLLKYNIIKEEDGLNRQKAIDILEQFSLSSKAGLKAYELSVGERKLLSLGCLLMNSAKFILLDELSSGLNSGMIVRLNQILLDLSISGVTFLMIEHDRELMEKICKTTCKMYNGKLTKA